MSCHVDFQEADSVRTDEVSDSSAAEISGEGDPGREEPGRLDSSPVVHSYDEILLQNRQVLNLPLIDKKPLF